MKCTFIMAGYYVVSVVWQIKLNYDKLLLFGAISHNKACINKA